MAHVLALIPDLMFGSRVQSAMTRAGHEVELAATVESAGERLSSADVLIVDLTNEQLGGPELVEAIIAGSSRDRSTPRTLGFYSHVDVETRERALRAGFDLVIPRSRMAREGGELVTRLAAAD